MPAKYRCVSADSHLEIAPDRWTHRVPAQHRDRAPRRFKLANGGDAIVVENRPLYVLGLAITGKPFEEHELTGVSYDTGPGAGSPQQRLKEQDRDGVDAEVLYTSAGQFMFWRGVKNDAAYRAMVHAYNEWLAEEYMVAAPDRLIAVPLIPITNIHDAVAELEYSAKAGFKTVALGTFPSGKGYPTKEDDRFWAAALDTNMPITIHVGFIGRQGPAFQYEKTPDSDISPFGSDPIQALGRFGGDACLNTIQIIMAGVFDRFPNLRLYWAETQAGWIPYFLEQMEDNWRRDRHWMHRYYGMKPPKHEPSYYVLENNYWGFIKDKYAVQHRHEMRPDRLMWASDFPHSASDWPNSQTLLDDMFAGVPAEERYALTCGNAIKFFHLEDGR